MFDFFFFLKKNFFFFNLVPHQLILFYFCINLVLTILIIAYAFNFFTLDYLIIKHHCFIQLTFDKVALI